MEEYSPSAEEVRALRDASQETMQVCKNALVLSNGDMNMAGELLRQRKVPTDLRIYQLEKTIQGLVEANATLVESNAKLRRDVDGLIMMHDQPNVS